MSVGLQTDTVAALTSPLEPSLPHGHGKPDVGPGRIWLARAIISAYCTFLAWFTWAHWGNFQIDNGRELYVPAEILKGKMLFRDLWYMYGPLAPYLKAFLFRIFGVQLNVLYVFGLTLAFATALLTYEVSRRFRLGYVGAIVPSIFFLTESFYPFIRNFVFPYSYAASLGTLFGMACLYFVLRHASGMRTRDLALASVFTALAALTKQEFGMACLAVLGFEIAASFRIRRSGSELLRNLGVACAGLIPAVAGYGWFVWKLSAKFVFFDNWISTPGTYFMRTFGKLTIPYQGLRFIPSELLLTAEFTLLSIAIWALLASLAASGIAKLRLYSKPRVLLIVTAILSPLWIATIAYIGLYRSGSADPSVQWAAWIAPLSQPTFPKGIFFIVIGLILVALWKLWTSPGSIATEEAALGIYAALIGVRQMMSLRPMLYDCAVFFNVPAFLVFMLLLAAIFRWACKKLDRQRANFTIGTLFGAEAALVVLAFYPNPHTLTTRLTTSNGSFYTRSDAATLFPQIISFMKSHTRNGRDILVLPEPPSLYVFAGMEAPSRWYSLVPGYVAPEQEQQYIDELAANHVRYVLIANRTLTEYGVQGFANGGYNVPIHDWIMANYVKVGQFGPLPDAPIPPYIVWVYARKDLANDPGEIFP